LTLDSRRVGDAIAAGAADLAGIWRATRREMRPEVFPGVVDGILVDFLTRAGEALAAGRDPALVWPETTGVVRVDPKAPFRSVDEIEAEWDLVAEVLAASCEALRADTAAAEWLSRAILFARAGARNVQERAAPRGILIVWALSGLSTRNAPRNGARR
jgi:hypothetical protein